jgi:uncharacterized membrane protein (UPF0127 family)
MKSDIRAIAAAMIAWFALAVTSATAADFQPLEIVTRSGVHVFTVEIAKTEQERATGLMYRKELAEGRGMLFDFSPEQPVSMWMKNTFIPLDMVFFDTRGRILRIHERAVPQTEDIIDSGVAVAGVLEILGGEARRRGLQVGDRLLHPRLDR